MLSKVYGDGSDPIDLVQACRKIFEFPGVPFIEKTEEYRGFTIVRRVYQIYNTDGDAWMTICAEPPADFDHSVIDEDLSACPNHIACAVIGNSPYLDRFREELRFTGDAKPNEVEELIRVIINQYAGRLARLKGRLTCD